MTASQVASFISSIFKNYQGGSWLSNLNQKIPLDDAEKLSSFSHRAADPF